MSNLMELCFNCNSLFHPNANEECVYHPNVYNEHIGWTCCGLLDQYNEGCMRQSEHILTRQTPMKTKLKKQIWDENNEVVIVLKHEWSYEDIIGKFKELKIMNYFYSIKPLENDILKDCTWRCRLKNQESYDIIYEKMSTIKDLRFIEKSTTQIFSKSN